MRFTENSIPTASTNLTDSKQVNWEAWSFRVPLVYPSSPRALSDPARAPAADLAPAVPDGNAPPANFPSPSVEELRKSWSVV
jgi:hypothetical protein